MARTHVKSGTFGGRETSPLNFTRQHSIFRKRTNICELEGGGCLLLDVGRRVRISNIGAKDICAEYFNKNKPAQQEVRPRLCVTQFRAHRIGRSLAAAVTYYLFSAV
jgi:hypothetical protein